MNINKFIKTLPERYQICWKFLLKLKHKRILNNNNNNVIYTKWYYIQIYTNKFLALLVCAYHLNILDKISNDIILDGFNYYGITSFEKEIINILCENQSLMDIIPIEYHECWIYCASLTRHDIYYALILSLLKLDYLNKISIVNLINDNLEDIILKLFIL
jgi:hypothetical protein